MSFLSGAKIGVLGANGCGKSSFMKILAGIDKDFDGKIWHRSGLNVSYLPQEPFLDDALTVIENVRLGIEKQEKLLLRYNEIGEKMGNADADFDSLLAEQATVQASIEELNAWNLQHEVEIAMSKLHLPHSDSPVSKLSGGERRRVALCRILLEKPDVLMLDEPTNHLDAESVSWLENYLRKFKGMVISVTHDRYFLDNIATWILEIDRGLMFPYEGNYSTWLEQKQRRLNLEKKHELAASKSLAKELNWIRTRGQAGNTSKARLANYKARADKVDSDRERLSKLLGGQIVIPSGPRLGDKVLIAEGLKKCFGPRVLFENLSFTVPPGATVGIVGANGCGKSTLFNILAGVENPDSGTVAWGATVKMGLISQSRAGLDPSKTAYQEIAQGVDTISGISVRAYVAAFNLKGPSQEKLVGTLSGGERNRVHLAKVLKEGHNVLLFDEPTNDLDVDTLRSLEQALDDFVGSALIISHDRFFLDRVCTHTLAFEDDGSVNYYSGNFSEYIRHMKSQGKFSRISIG